MSKWSIRYEYTDSNIRDNAPSTSGVYRLIYHIGESYYVFYVGQSDDLKKRLGEHLSASEVNNCIEKYIKECPCYFRFIELATQRERDAVEKEEILKYDPTCNK